MNKMEKIENALKRIKELFDLVLFWSKSTKKEDLLNKELKKRKKDLLKDLYIQLAALDDRYLFTHKSEFKTKEYVVEYENIKKQIQELEK
tara:strand:+ start:200 stop:469 length:270 start_codon:yes stop_codon:yes gene_type:complete